MVIEIIGRGQGHHTKEKLTHFFLRNMKVPSLKWSQMMLEDLDLRL